MGSRGPAHAGTRPKGAEHSPWEVLEHIRICQWDVVQQIADPKHASPDFPAGYWPGSAVPPNSQAWKKSLDAFRADFAAILRLAQGDLLAPIPHLEGQTILRRLMMLADHTAYHLGELVLLRRMLGDWKEPT
jgi:hypothetical protein